jgi:DNA-binding response OmpR family regulator
MNAVRTLLPVSQSTEQQALNANAIHWNIEQRSITVGHLVIRLTYAEYRLLFALHLGIVVAYPVLVQQVYGYAVMDEKIRLTLDKHIDRVRGKLRGTGVYVYCVLGYGYILLPEIATDY